MGILGAIGSVVGAGLGLLTQKNQDKRQFEQQKELQGLQVEGAKDLAQNAKENQLDIWNKTNYEAQKEHMKAAGLNPSLMYGMGGGGGATTGQGSAGMPTGAVAGGGDAGGMGLMQMSLMAAQKAVMESQARKNNAEAEKTEGTDTAKSQQDIEESKARVTTQEFQNKMNEMYGQANERARTMQNEIGAERENLNWEMYKAIAWGSGEVTDKNNAAAKALRAEFEQKVVDLANAKKDGRLKDAEAIIQEFGAKMANEGLAPNSPWYVKAIDTMLQKAGIHVTDTVNRFKK